MHVPTGKRWEYSFTEENAALFGSEFSEERGIESDIALRIVNHWNYMASTHNSTGNRYWLV